MHAPVEGMVGGTFQLFARDVFYRMGIEVEVSDVAPYPYEENMQDRDEEMTQSQFREYLIDGALKNHDTSFRWLVKALIPKEDGGEYQREAIMGDFTWQDDVSNEDELYAMLKA